LHRPRPVDKAPVKPVTVSTDAVLKAAGEWVSAQEALVAAQQASGEFETEEETVDIMGCRLVLAVTRWRSSR
jgi:hypothetical protein